MFKSKFNELMKSGTSSFEIIKDVEALSVEGGAKGCPSLKSCDNYTGDCFNLETCGTYSTGSISNPTPGGGGVSNPQLPIVGGGN